MKNKKLGYSLLILCSIGLMACSKEDTNASKQNDDDNLSQSEWVKKNKPEKNSTNSATFKKGIYKTEKYTLTINSSSIVKSPAERKEGLLVNYTFTNNTDDEEIVPADIIGINLVFKQKNNTSNVTIARNYHILDINGDDVENYNEMVEKSNISSQAILPGKSVEVIDGYSIDNIKSPVEVTALDPDDYHEIGTFEIKL